MQHNYHANGANTLGTFTPDNLIAAGCFDFVTEGITLKSGLNYVRGTVLEETVFGTAASAAKSGGNTGTGTLTLDATTPTLFGATPGVYTVRCITAATNGGQFLVNTPSGTSLGTFSLPGTAGGSATFSNQIKFALADGGTDFAVGDGFDITVTAVAPGAQKYQRVTADIRARAVLLEDVDATSADKASVAAFTGTFNKPALTIGGTANINGVQRTLEARNIYLRDTIAQVTAD